MKKVFLLLILCMVPCFLAFAGGGGDTGGSAAPKQEVLRFMWWGADPRHDVTLKTIALYEQKYPNVRIEGEYQGFDGYLRKLMTQIAGGTEPDIIQSDCEWIGDLQRNSSIFLPLAGNKNINFEPYPKSILDIYCTVDNVLVGLPMGSHGFASMINRAFYDKYNIPYDTVWTWEDIIAMGSKLNSGDYITILDSPSLELRFLRSYILCKYGKYWVDDNTNQIIASRAELIDGLSRLRELYTSGAVQPLGEADLFISVPEQNPKWANDEIGFIIEWSGTVDRFKNVIGAEKFGVTSIPAVKNGKMHVSPLKPMILAISNRTKYPDTATHFANFILDDPEATMIMEAQRSVPTNQDALKRLVDAKAVDPDVISIYNYSADNPAPQPPLIIYNPEINAMIMDINEELVYGRITPEAAADLYLGRLQTKLTSLKAGQ